MFGYIILNAKYQVYKDMAGKYRFRLRAANNKIVAVSEAYENKAGCMNGVKSVQKNCDSHVEDTTTEMEKKYCDGFILMTWGGTVPGKSLKWAYDEITDINDHSDRIVFIFSDFVLTQPGEGALDKTENYQILEKMLDYGVRICGCVSPLAKKSIFKPYTKKFLSEMEKLGIFMIDTYTPSFFLDQVNNFISQG